MFRIRARAPPCSLRVPPRAPARWPDSGVRRYRKSYRSGCLGSYRPRQIPSAVTRLPPLYLFNLVGFGAARGVDLDRDALGLADQRLGKRRGDRDAALLGVGFRLADDLPHLLLVGV